MASLMQKLLSSWCAQNAKSMANSGHGKMDKALAAIKTEASILRQLGEAEKKKAGKRTDPGEHWISGEYTDYNREHN